MKLKLILAVVVIVAVMAGLVVAYEQMRKEQIADEQQDQPVTAATSVQEDSNGLTTVSLELKAQQLIGLQTATPAAAKLPVEIKAYGRVLDSATLVSLHGDVLATGASLQSSQQLYQRLQQLASQNNASAQALETAEAQLAHDESSLETAKAQLVAASSPAILNEPASFFSDLSSQRAVLIRLDTAAGEWPAADSPAAANLVPPGMSRPLDAALIGRAAVADPLSQGVGFILVVTNAPPELSPGLAVTGFLQLPVGAEYGAIIPDTAVVRSDGSDWIYVEASQTNFERRKIVLDRPANGGWFVTNRLAADDKVVVAGAQVLLSEEHKAEIQMGD
ncbi:MAG TPA: hypothetical protein VGY98_04050 [Verrucomicrobiae bacterium]|nr:hypothetical protein [Verrucomicrobiae bacterium]